MITYTIDDPIYNAVIYASSTAILLVRSGAIALGLCVEKQTGGTQ